MLYKAYLVLYKMYIIMQLRRQTLKIRLRSHIAARSYVCEAAQQQARTRILFFLRACGSFAVQRFISSLKLFFHFLLPFLFLLVSGLGFCLWFCLGDSQISHRLLYMRRQSALDIAGVQQLVFLWSRLFWFRLRFGSSPLSLLLRHSSLGWFPLGTAGAA